MKKETCETTHLCLYKKKDSTSLCDIEKLHLHSLAKGHDQDKKCTVDWW